MVAAVLGPRRFVVTGIERTLFAVADGSDAAGVDAEGNEVLLGLVGAAVAEGQVVLLGAPLVAVAFDEQVVLRILLQPGCRRRERVLCIRGQRRVVVFEECILN